MSYADSVAPDEPAHPRNLIWELHCPLICRKQLHWCIRGQCSSQVRLHGCAGWSGATLSAYGMCKKWPEELSVKEASIHVPLWYNDSSRNCIVRMRKGSYCSQNAMHHGKMLICTVWSGTGTYTVCLNMISGPIFIELWSGSDDPD